MPDSIKTNTERNDDMKKFVGMSLAICMAFVCFVPAEATSKRNTENSASEGEKAESSFDAATHVYVENLPGKKKENSIYEGYTYNGVPIHVPDFERFGEHESSEIKTFSDAVPDYLGWDILLGTSDWLDDENCFYFNPIKNLSSTTNSTFGYGRRKFGYELIEFRVKINKENSLFDGNWMGISFMCTTTQSLQWTGNPGYLIVIKKIR